MQQNAEDRISGCERGERNQDFRGSPHKGE